MSDCKPSGEKPKDKERLCTGLVLDIILDGIRDEVLDLEEYLRCSTLSDLTKPTFVLEQCNPLRAAFHVSSYSRNLKKIFFLPCMAC